MSINVIAQTTHDRRAETQRLFHKVKPYLDQGYGLWSAAKKVTGKEACNSRNGWYRDLIEYCNSHGYKYNEMKGRRVNRNE